MNNTTEYRVEGIVSLSDVLRFIVIQQARSGTSAYAPPPPPSVAEEPDESTDESAKPPKPRQRTIKFELSPAHESDKEEARKSFAVRRDDRVLTEIPRPTKRHAPILKDSYGEGSKINAVSSELLPEKPTLSTA